MNNILSMIFWNCVASTRIEIVWYPWAEQGQRVPGLGNRYPKSSQAAGTIEIPAGMKQDPYVWQWSIILIFISSPQMNCAEDE